MIDWVFCFTAFKGFTTSNLNRDLLAEVVFNPQLRPRLATTLTRQFERRRHRLDDAWAPSDTFELVEWVKERSAIPIAEWTHLLQAMDADIKAGEDIIGITIGHAQLVVATEDAVSFEQLLQMSSPTDNAERLNIWLANWLQYYGPISADRISHLLGLPLGVVETQLTQLLEEQEVIEGKLIEQDDSSYWCDADNYEYLLRISRSNARPRVEPKSAESLTTFLYQWQTQNASVGRKSDQVDDVYEIIDKLRGISLPAALWESDVLPARIPGYTPQSLDLLFTEGEIQWLGTGEGKVTLCFRGDHELFTQTDTATPVIADKILPDVNARYDFLSLLDRTGMSAGELVDRLWQSVWQGSISNDSMSPLRQGINTGFKGAALTTAANARTLDRTLDRATGRSGYRRWRSATPLAGNWFAIQKADAEELDPLSLQELNKDRTRILLNRYGIIFRELCERELPAFKWSVMFRVLRLMELSGEVVSGYFFEGLRGPQFMSPVALGLFNRPSTLPPIFLNAIDPISPIGLVKSGVVKSGVGACAFGEQLPRRTKSNHLVIHDDKLVMTSTRHGKALNILVPPDHPELLEYFTLLHHLCYRHFQPVKPLRIETINNEPAATSAYLVPLGAKFNVITDFRSVVIQREL